MQDVENCDICRCYSKEKCDAAYSNMMARIHSSDLNESQEAAVLSCINTKECRHQNSVKLIWGPPGTGKTKTVGFLLHSLLRMKCRTLTCAPTNIAVLEVTERLLKKVEKESLEYDTYGLGDIVLFGNGERMKIIDHNQLLDVFLDYRVDRLEECFCSRSAWKESLISMISLLKKPEMQYRLYLNNRQGHEYKEEEKKNEVSENGEDTSKNRCKETSNKNSKDKKGKKGPKKLIVQTLNENKGKKKVEDMSSVKEKNQPKSEEKVKKCDDPLTFEEFIKRRFNCIEKRLASYIVDLYTHLPTSIISLEIVKKMASALDSLKSFQMLLDKEVISIGEPGGCFRKLSFARTQCLSVLKSLPQKLPVPDFSEKYEIKQFCLENACLIFCTVSSSAKLYTKGMTPFQLLVIDEAAQLKECESTIPLQLPGVRHAILIGDERQLPAMVKSKVFELHYNDYTKWFFDLFFQIIL